MELKFGIKLNEKLKLLTEGKKRYLRKSHLFDIQLMILLGEKDHSSLINFYLKLLYSRYLLSFIESKKN
jgi:hypothetical protein